MEVFWGRPQAESTRFGGGDWMVQGAYNINSTDGQRLRKPDTNCNTAIQTGKTWTVDL